jgi:hypothetical protein
MGRSVSTSISRGSSSSSSREVLELKLEHEKERSTRTKLSLTVGAAHSAIKPMYPHYEGSSSLEPSCRHLTFLGNWRARRTPAFSMPAVNCFKILHFRARHSASVKQSFDYSPNRTVPTRNWPNYENEFGTARNSMNEVTVAPSAGPGHERKRCAASPSARCRNQVLMFAADVPAVIAWQMRSHPGVWTGWQLDCKFP